VRRRAHDGWIFFFFRLLSDYGTYRTVTARCWPWLELFFRRKSLKLFERFPTRLTGEVLGRRARLRAGTGNNLLPSPPSASPTSTRTRRKMPRDRTPRSVSRSVLDSRCRARREQLKVLRIFTVEMKTPGTESGPGFAIPSSLVSIPLSSEEATTSKVLQTFP